MFRNRLKISRKDELERCNNLLYDSCYLTGSGPYGESTKGFKNLLESGDRVKFVISSRGMFIGKPSISHAAIASFQQVITAGYVRRVRSTVRFDTEKWRVKVVKRLEI